jgi:tetratricopeptide (TPR) repeat protein
MKQVLFALAIGAVAISAVPAQASIGLSAGQCINKHIAPADRIVSCKNYQEDGITMANERHLADYALALAYRLNGQYAEAEALTSTVIREAPQWPNAIMERSTAYAEDGKYDLALADTEKLKGLSDDKGALADMQRCWVRAVAGRDLDSAIADCNAALAVYPKSFAVFMARALVNYKRGDMAATIADCTAALDNAPKIAGALYLRGIAKGTAGADDIDAAKRLEPYIGNEFAGYGVKS